MRKFNRKNAFRIDWHACEYFDILPKSLFKKKCRNLEETHTTVNAKDPKDTYEFEFLLTVQEKEAILDYRHHKGQPDCEKGVLRIYFTNARRNKMRADGYEWLPQADIANAESKAEGERVREMRYITKRASSLAQDRKIKDHHTCQACGYCQLVNGKYIEECHHLYPVHMGERKTSLKDLRTLCPNCHRIAHTSNPPLTVPKIKETICALK